MTNETPGSPAPRKLPRHLMDPNNPTPPSTRPTMSLTQVQKWVMSTLAVTTILHLAGGNILGAFAVDESRVSTQVGFLLVSGAFGMVAVAAGVAIHGRPILTWWLLLGWIPPIIAAWFLFGR